MLIAHFLVLWLLGATVQPFGSFVSNLFTRWGDLDLSVDLFSGSSILFTGKKQKQTLLGHLLRALRASGDSFSFYVFFFFCFLFASLVFILYTTYVFFSCGDLSHIHYHAKKKVYGTNCNLLFMREFPFWKSWVATREFLVIFLLITWMGFWRAGSCSGSVK